MYRSHDHRREALSPTFVEVRYPNTRQEWPGGRHQATGLRRPAGGARVVGRTVAAVVFASLVFSGHAVAEEATMLRAIQAVSLHDGPLDMAAYYVPVDEAFEVTATFAAREGEYAPMRIVMAMADGDDVAFAMPGYPEALYRFVRSGSAVTVTSRQVTSEGM